MEPVTSAAGTRLGQRVTFAVIDEPHLMSKRNGGHKLVATVRRNAGKMNGRTFESTNAHLPGEDTVAERTHEAYLKGASGLLYDSREGDQVDDLGDREAVLASLRQAYGDSVAFVDIERIADEIADPATDPSDARRFYLNQLVGDVNDFVDVQAWDALGSSRAVAPGERIALGFDGSISDDATALWGCTEDLFLFPLRVWERPTDRGEWKVPRAEVHEEIRDAFDRYDVGLLVADPPKWWSEIEEWSATYGESRVESLDTNSGRRFAPICDRFATAVREGSLSHDGDLILRAHLSATSRKTVRANADAADGRTQFVIVKKDHRKIDAAVAACLALYGAEVMPEKTVHREVKARWI